jgi:hypothetical protein
MVAMGTQICKLKNSITELTLLCMYGWLAGKLRAILGSKCEVNAKIPHNSSAPINDLSYPNIEQVVATGAQIAMGLQICELKNSITELTILCMYVCMYVWLAGWLGAILGRNVKLMRKSPTSLISSN